MSLKFICVQETADSLEIERIGSQHQAGSDSLLTSATFFKVFSFTPLELQLPLVSLQLPLVTFSYLPKLHHFIILQYHLRFLCCSFSTGSQITWFGFRCGVFTSRTSLTTTSTVADCTGYRAGTSSYPTTWRTECHQYPWSSPPTTQPFVLSEVQDLWEENDLYRIKYHYQFYNTIAIILIGKLL